MKTKIMKTVKALSYVTFVLFLGMAISSCSPDDGVDGINGINGINGTDGADGADGADGSDGSDGADGNANVSTYVFNSPTWSDSLSYIQVTIPGLETHVSNGDAILSYMSLDGNNIASIPGTVITNSGNKSYGVSFLQDFFYVISYDFDGTRTATVQLPDIVWLKVIIIESTSTTGGKGISKKQAVYNELEDAGVDITDYNAVCEYYNIDIE